MTHPQIAVANQTWRVIVIDDNADERAEVRRLLLLGSERRYHFDEAGTAAAGVRAVRAAAEGPPDCVLLDYHLPDSDALAVLAQLSNPSDPDGGTICPVVVMTGDGGGPPSRRALHAGAQDFIGKSWMTAESLTRIVENAVERFALARHLRERDAVIRESEARLRLTLEASHTGLWTWDLGTDAVVWSPEVYLIGGFAEGSLEPTGQVFFSLVHPDDRARMEAAVTIAIRDRTRYECEFRLVRPDGRTIWVQNRGRASYDAAGEPVRVLGTITDVTDRRTAEEALRASERDLQTLADNAPSILARFDRDLRHVFINAAIERISGLPPSHFLGRTNREIGMPDHLCELWDGALRQVLATGKQQNIEFSFSGPAGERHFVSRLVPEPGPDGTIARVLSVVHDITDHRLAEEALKEADRRKDEFLATLAHELRNPLAPIRSALDLLLSSAAEPHKRKALDVMERQLGHVVRLVDDLLDISRISRGKVELRRERVQLRDVLEHAVESSRSLLDKAGHALSVEAPAEPIWLDGDLTRLAQVIGNLLNNAAKYTPEGGRVELAAGLEGGAVVIHVTDNGAGIAPEMLPRVFDLFTQVNATLDRAQGGLGIGLSLVRKFVEMHGGTVEARSAGLGRGSTFTIRLPLAAAPAEAPATAQARAAGAVPPARRVLVVDDDVDGAELLVTILEFSGHQTRMAHDGLAALVTAEEFRPEVVFLDIGLPGIDGYEVARRLRNEATPPWPVLVALTGWEADAVKQQTAAAFDYHLTKPIERAAVDGVLARLPAAPPGDAGESSAATA